MDFSKEELLEEIEYNVQHCFCSERTKRLLDIAKNVLTAEDIDGSKIAHVYLDMTTVDKVEAYVKGSNARLAKLLK